MTDIFILAAQRAAIGSYGGSLKDTAPIELAIPVAKDAIAKSGIPADAIGHAVHVPPVGQHLKIDIRFVARVGRCQPDRTP